MYFFSQSGKDILFFYQVTAQSLLPDLEGFLRMDDELKDDQECQKWSKEEIVEDKVTQNLLVNDELDCVTCLVYFVTYA